MRTVIAVLTLAAATVAGAALANDGVAERAAGGLVFKATDEIDMLSEDLYVSRDEIRVRYRFRNRTANDVRVTVAFPLPDHDLREDFYGDTAYPRDFRTTVDGRPIEMRTEYRAVWEGADHTDLLTSLGIPITYGGGNIDAIVGPLSALPEADRRRLLELGLVEEFDFPGEGRRVTPLWTVKEAWYREQLFPAGRDVIVEHRYRPGAGGTLGTGLAGPNRLDSDYNREMIARYCIDEDFLAAVDRIASRDGPEYFGESYVSYILTTGAGWASPIGEFRLVVDKGRPENLVSFCGEDVRRISPTRFEMRRRNWRPDRDLHVLIMQPRPRGRE